MRCGMMPFWRSLTFATREQRVSFACRINNLELIITTTMEGDEPLTSENAVPSSPPPAVFSDDLSRTSSPPSSPPGFPWEKDESVKRIQAPGKSAFSLLGKRKTLESISDNARPAKKAATATSKPTSKALTQMQISLGQEVQKKCKTCGMEYIASSIEDRTLHDKYHKQNTEGYDVGKDFVQKARNLSVFKGASSDDTICALDCYDKPARKRRGQAVLEVVQRELGAVEIPAKQIWHVREADTGHVCEPRFRVYLYTRRARCIGFLLVQRINEACRVEEPPQSLETSTKTDETEQIGATGALNALKARQRAAIEKAQHQLNQPISLSNSAYSARLGISRIWTSPTHRGQNIATTLLDTAFEHHNQRAERQESARVAAERGPEKSEMSKELRAQIDGLIKPMERIDSKELVAFSQPTEAGVRLARRWFGKMWAWSVYVD